MRSRGCGGHVCVQQWLGLVRLWRTKSQTSEPSSDSEAATHSIFSTDGNCLAGEGTADLQSAVNAADGHPLRVRAERMLLQTNVLLLEALQPHLQDTNSVTSRLTGDWRGSHPGLSFMTGSIRLVMSSLAARNISLSTQTECSCCLNLIGQRLAWRLEKTVKSLRVFYSESIL